MMDVFPRPRRWIDLRPRDRVDGFAAAHRHMRCSRYAGGGTETQLASLVQVREPRVPASERVNTVWIKSRWGG